MPLDGHNYLVQQGWEGQGSGLRHGAISRPIIVAQKKNMGGIGKDRDEAFPFWDHVFNAAASAIKVKCYDSDSEDTESSTPAVSFQKTKTGIISNRRPVTGTPASGTATPSEDPSASSSGTSTPRLSVMAAAKQQAARRMLYSMFFRGPTLGTDTVEEQLETLTEASTSQVHVEVTTETLELKSKGKKGKKEKKEKKIKIKRVAETEAGTATGSKSKGKARAEDSQEDSKKSRKREPKEFGAEDREKTSKKRKRLDDEVDGDEDEEARKARKLAKAEKKRLKAEKRAKKEEKRRLKEERKNASVAADEEHNAGDGGQAVAERPSTKDESSIGAAEPETRSKRETSSKPKSKKKRKAVD